MKKTKKLSVFLLLAILVLAGVLYFYKLNAIPAGLYVDEAVAGYNAYSLLKTGKDEYGKAFPLALRFFGSYTPPLFVYLLIPFIWLFGLKVWVIRSVSGLSMLGGILIVFFFLKSIAGKRKRLSLTGALIFAVSPWTVFYARIGYEVTLAFFVYSLASLLLWLGLKKPKFRIAGFVLLSISAYAAHTEKYLAPLLMVLLLIFFRKEFIFSKGKRATFFGLGLAFLVQLPQIFLIKTAAFWNKNDLFYTKAIANFAKTRLAGLPPVLSIPYGFLREFCSQTLTYFSPRSLFFLPDPDPQRSIPRLSVFYGFMVLFYLVGIYQLYINRKKSWAKYLLILSLSAPIPAALTGDPFSTQRALPLLLPMAIILALGGERLMVFIKKRWQRLLIIALLMVISLFQLRRGYFIFLPQERARVWGLGFKELAEFIRSRPQEKFLIDQSSRIKPVYIELAFFNLYPPEKIQEAADPAVAKNYYAKTVFTPFCKLENVDIRNIEWEEDIYKEQIIIGDELAVSPDQAKEHFFEKVFEVRDPLDILIFNGFSTNPREKCEKGLSDIHCLR